MTSQLSPEEYARLAAQVCLQPLTRILGRPENAELRAEWDCCERLQQQVLDAFQMTMIATDDREVVRAASFVARELPQLAVRRLAARRWIHHLLEREPPPAFRLVVPAEKKPE